jgi:hypothetical protein
MSSCAVAASAALLWLAAGPQGMREEPPLPPPAVAHEPLFADIMARARTLKAQADGIKTGDPVTEDFRRGVRELSELDMKAHFVLAERKVDGDLKCILKGISEDLPQKLQALDEAKAPQARRVAIEDMAYLLNDNVEVITAPPAPAV